MRRALTALALLLVCAPTGPAQPLLKGLEVHEWGVWRVHDDLALANADVKSVWDGLPKFVYGQVDGRALPKHWQNLEAVDKPVIFFHTEQPVQAVLRVEFPGGLPAVWWPGTEEPSFRFGRPVGPGPGEPARALSWRFNLKQPPPGRPERPLLPVEKGHWVETLREVGGADVFAHVGEERFGLEREKFLYYDGLLPRGQWVSVKVEKERVTLTSRATHPLFDVVVTDRRRPGQLRVARLDRMGPGATQALVPAEADVRRWPIEAEKALVEQLSGAGLFVAEAKSLVALWRQDLLLAEGVTLFYRLPQEEYERLLPLKMAPRPEKLVRVGLVQHPHCEPDLADRVAQLVKGLGADDFEAREKAQKELDALGRAAFVHLVRLRDAATEVEVRRRLDELLRKHEGRLGFPGRP
jgi:hypothetical protein